jgi:hypothetical protein
MSPVQTATYVPGLYPPSPSPPGGEGEGGVHRYLSLGERARVSAVQLILGGARGRSGAQSTNYSERVHVRIPA